MSFIRSTSNPERLYVFHDCDGYINFCNKGDPVLIPANIFNKFIKEIGDNNHGHFNNDFKCGSLEIKEKYFPLKKKKTKFDIELNWNPGNYKMVLYYRGIEIARMWAVTWSYIANNVYKNILLQKQKKKKIKKVYVI